MAAREQRQGKLRLLRLSGTSEQARCPPGPGVHTGAQAQAAPSQDDAVDRPAQGLGLPCCSPPRPFRPLRRPPPAGSHGGSRVTRWQVACSAGKLAPLAAAAARRGGGPIFPAAPVGMVGRGSAVAGGARPGRRYHGRTVTMRRIAWAKTSSPAAPGGAHGKLRTLPLSEARATVAAGGAIPPGALLTVRG
jgi:hypothetical protein